jgi:hypothetical protein
MEERLGMESGAQGSAAGYDGDGKRYLVVCWRLGWRNSSAGLSTLMEEFILDSSFGGS